MRRTDIRGEEAQGLVEFALFIFVALLIFLGVIDFSRFMYYDQAIRSAARVGAEVAGNHCTPFCGALTVTTEDWVVSTVVCEAGITLNPQPPQGCNGCQTVTSGNPPGGCNDPYNPSSSTYTSFTAPSLTQDVYVTPQYTPTNAALPSSPTTVTVYVGYNFTPINPIMQQFFPTQTCFPSGSTGESTHTLCAQATGKIST